MQELPPVQPEPLVQELPPVQPEPLVQELPPALHRAAPQRWLPFAWHLPAANGLAATTAYRRPRLQQLA